LSTGLCPDPLGELTVLPPHPVKGGKGREGEEGKGRGGLTILNINAAC